MTVEAKDLLQFAKNCAGTQDEVTRRAAISRAYYACYHVLLAIVAQYPAVRPLDGHVTHREIANRLDSWNVGANSPLKDLARQAQRAAADYRVLVAARVEADYKLDLPIFPGALIEHMKRSERLIFQGLQLAHQIKKRTEPTPVVVE